MTAPTWLWSADSLVRFARVAACVVVCGGCTDAVPARIDIPADTLVINSTLWTPTGIRILNREGEVIAHPHASFSATPDSLLEVSSSGAVNCYNDGVGTIAVVAGALRRRATIVCRLVHRFGPIGEVHLLAGGAPVSLGFGAYDARGRVMPAVRLQLFIDGLRGASADVIALRHGLVYGLRPGTAMITAMSWGKEGGEVFVVDSAPCERVSAPPSGNSGEIVGRAALRRQRWMRRSPALSAHPSCCVPTGRSVCYCRNPTGIAWPTSPTSSAARSTSSSSRRSP